jgi:hypothetical protein
MKTPGAQDSSPKSRYTKIRNPKNQFNNNCPISTLQKFQQHTQKNTEKKKLNYASGVGKINP